MFVWPHIVKVYRCHKEDDPQRQQNQQAIADGHDTLVVTIGSCVGLRCRLLGIPIMAIAAAAE